MMEPKLIRQSVVKACRSVAAAICFSSAACYAQTTSSGAISGTVTDATGAAIREATVQVQNLGTGEIRLVKTGSNGRFSVPLLPAGDYKVEIQKDGFSSVLLNPEHVNITETLNLPVALSVGGTTSVVTVNSSGSDALTTDSSSRGDIVGAATVTGLPLVTRNYTQVIGLSAGVTSDVTNAAELGRGSGGVAPTGASPNGTFAHGARGYDNDFEINGLRVNDLLAQGTTSGGVAIPNPDTILEFKVQTSQYDATVGGHGGASVNLLTRGGSNQFHGTVFEFFRNRVVNANNYFVKQTGQVRPILNQNVYGATLGGPIKKDKLFFFGSYQGTRQANGVSSLTTVFGPALTDDRSAQAIGTLYAGQRGTNQGTSGPAILANGSNVNPVALNILQAKLPSGQYLIPTPQAYLPGNSIGARGESIFTIPSYFNENQYMANGDAVITPRQTLLVRFFAAKSQQVVAIPTGNLPGHASHAGNTFYVTSLEHDWIPTPNLINQARIGFNRTQILTNVDVPFAFSDLGITAPAQANPNPSISISGSVGFGTTNKGNRLQNSYLIDDTGAWSRHGHTVKFGGGAAWYQRNLVGATQPGSVGFLSFADFLLGLNASQNGTGVYSNINSSSLILGVLDRANRFPEAYGFAQDDWKLTSQLTLNLGFRYDFLPPGWEANGRGTNLDITKLTAAPGTAGSLTGIILPANYRYTVPSAQVTVSGNNSVVDGNGKNAFQPRVGFAWQAAKAIVVRGGYGIYMSRTNGQVQTQGTTTQPFGAVSGISGTTAAAATFANPFAGAVIPASFPYFSPYTSTSALSSTALDMKVQPGFLQMASLSTQTALPYGWSLELANVDVKAVHLLNTSRVNQALFASASNPVNGVTTSTTANISSRVPHVGWSVSGLQQIQSEGASWYNDLEATLKKRFGGSQVMAAYTWSKTTDTDAANVNNNSISSGGIGDNSKPFARYGVSSQSRPHRLIANYVYELPWFREGAGYKHYVLGGWSGSGVVTIQSGHVLTITGTNSANVYGQTSDRAQLANGCSNNMVAKSGSVDSKLTSYFNTSCLSKTWTVIGNGSGTGFGNSGVGIVHGPAQNNLDLAIVKHTRLESRFIHDVDFRAEFFNAFNSGQFSDPDSTITDAAFGVISSTSVAARIIQFGLKLNY